MTEYELKTYKKQKDNNRPLFVLLTVIAVINIVVLLISVSTLTIFAVYITDLIVTSYYYCNHNRYCDNCKEKMKKDYSSGLLCENHYCEKCRTVVKMKIWNSRD